MDKKKNSIQDGINKGEGKKKETPKQIKVGEYPKQVKVGDYPPNSPIQVQNEESLYSEMLNQEDPFVIVPLPSKGLLYPEFNGHKLDKVKVYDLLLPDERILTDPYLANKSETIDVLLREKVKFVDETGTKNIINPPITVDDLLLGDRMTIMVMLRISLDRFYKYVVQDPYTQEPINGTADLAELKTKELKVLPDENLEYKYKLPKSGKVVNFKILTVRDEKIISMRAEQERIKGYSVDDMKIIYRFETMITAIDGNRDKFFISNFCKKMPLMDSRHLNKYIDSISPNIDLTIKVRSKEGRDFYRFLPTTSEFFFPTIELH